MSNKEIGDRPKFQTTFTTDGTPADPTVVKFLLRLPDGTETVYVSPDVTNPSVGVYEFENYQLVQAGEHCYRFNGSGAVVASAESTFTVRETCFTAPLP